MSTLSAKEYKCFEDIKRVRPDGSEYWAARELAPVLDYAKWENFYKVIKRAMIACENSGRSTLECFPEVRKTSPMPNGGVKDILDYELSRYACYLIVQNGDPRKEVIALGQTYFAIQTYRQEVADRFNQLDEDSRRLVVRGDIKQWNQLLAETARNAGVITAEEFAIFQNAGYMGLYGEAYHSLHAPIHLLSCDETGAQQLQIMAVPDYRVKLTRLMLRSAYRPPPEDNAAWDGLYNGHPFVIGADMDLRRIDTAVRTAKQHGCLPIALAALEGQGSAVLLRRYADPGYATVYKVTDHVLAELLGRTPSLYTPPRTQFITEKGDVVDAPLIKAPGKAGGPHRK